MKRKNIISLTIAIAFLILGSSGILLYLKQKPHFVEMTHTIFGLLFISFAIFHIKNNWNSIKSYSKDKVSGSFKKELAVASLIGGVILILSVTEILEPVAEFGRVFAPARKKGPQGINFEEKTNLEGQQGQDATLILQKKASASSANLTVSLQDSSGNLVATLYENKEASEGPKPNILLHTKIAAATPFRIVITGTYESQSLKDEFLVSKWEKGVSSIAGNDSKLLERAYLEIK